MTGTEESKKEIDTAVADLTLQSDDAVAVVSNVPAARTPAEKTQQSAVRLLSLLLDSPSRFHDRPDRHAEFAKLVAVATLQRPQLALQRHSSGRLLLEAVIICTEPPLLCQLLDTPAFKSLADTKNASLALEVTLVFIAHQRLDAFRSLLNHGATFSVLATISATLLPLCMADRDIWEIVTSSASANPSETVDAGGYTLLHHYVTLRQQNPTLDLSHCRASLSTAVDRPALGNGWTALHYAASHGDAALVTELLELAGNRASGEAVNARAYDDSTPLHQACLSHLRRTSPTSLGAYDAVKVLTRNQSDLSATMLPRGAPDIDSDGMKYLRCKDLVAKCDSLQEMVNRDIESNAIFLPTSPFMRWVRSPGGLRKFAKLVMEGHWRNYCNGLNMDPSEFANKPSPSLAFATRCLESNLFPALYELVPTQVRKSVSQALESSLRR